MITPASDATKELLPQLVKNCSHLTQISLDQINVEHMINSEQDTVAVCSPREGARWRKRYPDNIILLALVFNDTVDDYVDYVLTDLDAFAQVKGIIISERSRRSVINSRSAGRLRHSFDYTATAYVLNEDNTRVLMILKSDGRWFPPGGHVEEGEFPHEAVVREVREETGYSVRFIQQPADTGTGQKTGEAILLPLPYQILLEDITTHYHHDFIYLCHIEGEQRAGAEYEGQWIELARVPELPAPDDIHATTQQLLQLFGSPVRPT